MTAIPTIVQKTVPFKSIFIPDDNYRQGDLPDVEEIAADLKLRGQLEPVIVAKGAPDDRFDYTLVGGARRMAGYVANRWQGRDILVTVRTYAKGDVFGPIFDNVASNEQSRPTSVYDKALLCHQLVTGTHPRAEGQALEKKEVEKRLGMEPTYLGKMLKIAKNVDPKVAKKARAQNASFRMFLTLADMKGEGDDDETRLDDRAAKQAAYLEEWIATQKQLAAEGRTRKTPERKSKSKATETDEKAPEPPEAKRARVVGKAAVDDKARSGVIYLRALQRKVTTVTAKEAPMIQGAIDATRFFVGETKTMKGILTEADLKAIEKEDAEEAAAALITVEDEEVEGEGEAGDGGENDEAE